MKRLPFKKTTNLSLLHDELLAAMPDLRPVPNLEGRVNALTGEVELEPVMTVEGNDTNIWLTVPGNTDEAAVANVVAAHDPITKPADPKAERQARIAELLAIPRSDWTAAQQRELLQVAAQELTR